MRFLVLAFPCSPDDGELFPGHNKKKFDGQNARRRASETKLIEEENVNVGHVLWKQFDYIITVKSLGMSLTNILAVTVVGMWWSKTQILSLGQVLYTYQSKT